MFEGLIADVLTKTIGKYIQDLDTNSINVSIWNGNVKLNKLQLKKNAFTELNLPVNVRNGILNKLELVVPWKTIKTDPFKIEITGLNVILEPETIFLFDEKEYKRKQ